MGILIKKSVCQEEKHCLLLFFPTNAKLRHHDISYSVLKGFINSLAIKNSEKTFLKNIQEIVEKS